MRNKQKKSSRKMLRTAQKRARLYEKDIERIAERGYKKLMKMIRDTISHTELQSQ